MSTEPFQFKDHRPGTFILGRLSRLSYHYVLCKLFRFVEFLFEFWTAARVISNYMIMIKSTTPSYEGLVRDSAARARSSRDPIPLL